MVMSDSPEAATRVTITGWVSRHGRFYGEDEWAGSPRRVARIGTGKTSEL